MIEEHASSELALVLRTIYANIEENKLKYFIHILFLLLFLQVIFMISSVQFSHSVMSDSLRPHELQHARPPCPTHVHRVSDAIKPYHPLLAPSLPAPNPSQHQRLFA